MPQQKPEHSCSFPFPFQGLFFRFIALARLTNLLHHSSYRRFRRQDAGPVAKRKYPPIKLRTQYHPCIDIKIASFLSKNSNVFPKRSITTPIRWSLKRSRTSSSSPKHGKYLSRIVGHIQFLKLLVPLPWRIQQLDLGHFIHPVMLQNPACASNPSI